MTVKFFHAEWCQPCNQFHPIIEKYCKDRNIEFEDHDIMDSDEVELFKIRSVPTTLIFDDNCREVHRFSGLKSVIQLDALIKDLTK